MAHFEELIIVPGHASFKEEVGLPLAANFQEDSRWALQSFQHGEPPYYIEHIRKALNLVNDRSLLVFSGGKTRKESGQIWSEAKTYDEIAKTFLNYPLGQVALEEYARDSFQNLDLSIRMFEKSQGIRPHLITVVGWTFKEERFQFHAQTLNLQSSFRYAGANNPRPEDLESALVGEAKTLRDFAETPHGDKGILLEKRLSRDPWDEGDPTNY